MIDNVDWKAEILRITVFPVDTASFSAADSWEQIIGRSPDNLNVQRSGLETREIAYLNGRVFLIKQLDRIECQYVPKQMDDSLSWPTIGDYKEELETFLQLIDKWHSLISASPIQRLAFGAVLHHSVASEQEGNQVLQKILPHLYVEGARDFFYQVNRRRESSHVNGLLINRLARWSVGQGQVVNVHITPQLSQSSHLHFATRLELDINTVPVRFDSFLSDKTVDLFNELVKFGVELSRDGDIP